MQATAEQEAQRQRKTVAQKRRLKWCLFGLLLLTPLWPYYTATQRDNLLEAIVRDMNKDRNNSVFLTIDNADPSDDFLDRFENDSFVVRKASQAIDKTPPELRRLWPPASVLFDPVTGKRGGKLSMRSGTIKLYGPFYANVEIYFTGSSQFFTLVRKPNGWTVTGTEIGSIV